MKATTFWTYSSLAITRQIKDLAYRQLGSSGSGNHFVDVIWNEYNNHP